jgi:hypothetical protein
LFFGGGGRASHAFEEYLSQRIAGLDLGLIEETDQLAVAPGSVVNITHVANIEGRGLRRELLNKAPVPSGRYRAT